MVRVRMRFASLCTPRCAVRACKWPYAYAHGLLLMGEHRDANAKCLAYRYPCRPLHGHNRPKQCHSLVVRFHLLAVQPLPLALLVKDVVAPASSQCRAGAMLSGSGCCEPADAPPAHHPNGVSPSQESSRGALQMRTPARQYNTLLQPHGRPGKRREHAHLSVTCTTNLGCPCMSVSWARSTMRPRYTESCRHHTHGARAHVQAWGMGGGAVSRHPS